MPNSTEFRIMVQDLVFNGKMLSVAISIISFQLLIKYTNFINKRSNKKIIQSYATLLPNSPHFTTFRFQYECIYELRWWRNEPVHCALVGNNTQGSQSEARWPMDQHRHATTQNLLVSLPLQYIYHFKIQIFLKLENHNSVFFSIFTNYITHINIIHHQQNK